MRRDERPVVEQIKSGFLIVTKMLAAVAIAVTFLLGFTLIRTPRNWPYIAFGWLLVTVSVVAMITTVRFWAAGFFGFVAYGALRSLAGILVADAFHVSRLYMVIVSASVFAMALLSYRFISKNLHLTPTDRAGIVVAASCLLATVLFGDTYKGIAVFNAGNVALLLSWWAARLSGHNRHKRHTAPPVTA
jgi:hypothetical protein